MNSTPEEGRTLIHRIVSAVEPLDISGLFSQEQPLELELGSGDGGFLMQYVVAHPERNFMGVERLLGRLRKLDRKGLRAGLRNLRLLRIEAGYLLDHLLPRECVQCLHVYFPDPWPKRRHRANRLINERFPARAVRVLRPAGRVYLRTDSEDYFAQMREVFSCAAGFEPVETPGELAGYRTDFEKDFNVRGVPTLRAAFQRAR